MTSQNAPQPGAGIVLWSVAAEPLFLAAVAYLLGRTGAVHLTEKAACGDTLLVVFAALSLAMLWASFRFASGRFAPRDPALVPAGARAPFAHQIIAVALATAPGVLGFVHYLLCGADWVLLVFNLGAFAAAARHVLNFSPARP